jgi:hypothetical protein
MKLIATFFVGCGIGSFILVGIDSMLGKAFERVSQNPHEEKKYAPNTVRRA